MGNFPNVILLKTFGIIEKSEEYAAKLAWAKWRATEYIAAQKQDEESELLLKEGNLENKAPRIIIFEDKGTTNICWMDFEISLSQQKDSDQNSSELMPQSYSQIQVQTKISTFLSGR